MEWGGRVVNHVKAFLVKELGKNFILKFSLLAKSPASTKYLAMCSTVDSFVSPANLVNLGIFTPLGNSVCNTYSDNGDTKLGLCKPKFKPFCTKIVSTIWARLFCLSKRFCWIFPITSSAFWFLFTNTIPGFGSTCWTGGSMLAAGCGAWAICIPGLLGICISWTGACIWICRIGGCCMGGAPKKSAIRLIWFVNIW